MGAERGGNARAPARLAQFERYLRHLQAYLAGEAVGFDDIDIPKDAAPPMSELELADAPPQKDLQAPGAESDGVRFRQVQGSLGTQIPKNPGA